MAHLNIDFISYSLGRAVHLTAIIPTACSNDLGEHSKNGYADKPLFPVVYLLHGYLNNESTWCEYTSVERYAEERQIALIMMSGENKFYVNKGSDRYFDFINKELPDFCEHMFPISPSAEDRYIAGLSMGGFGSAIEAFSSPEKYRAVGLFSAPLCDTSFTKRGGILPLPILQKKVKEVSSEAIPDIFVGVGSLDDFVKDNKRFVSYCKKAHLDHHFEIIDGYDHEWGVWDILVQHFLDWIPRTDFYSDKKRRI